MNNAISDWMADHGEVRFITLAAAGYDSYYPEYEEYFEKTETNRFCEQITLLPLILLSRYPANITLYKNNDAVSIIVDSSNLDGVANALQQSFIDDDYTLSLWFSDKNDNQFTLSVSSQLVAAFCDVPPTEWMYIEQLLDKVGLSSFLDEN